MKAPGTPKRTTLPWPRTSADVVASGPLSPKVNTFTSGTWSPTAIVIAVSLSWSWARRPRLPYAAGDPPIVRHPRTVTKL